MAHPSRTDLAQLLPRPEAGYDHMEPDKSVHFIEAFVDGLDLAAAGFAPLAAKETGCLGYDPAAL